MLNYNSNNCKTAMEGELIRALFLVLNNQHPYYSPCGSPFRLCRANSCIADKEFLYYIVFLWKGVRTAIGANDEYLASLPTPKSGSIVDYDSKKGILFSKKDLITFLNSYYLVSNSGNRFYVIRPENWSYIPEQAEFLPRCSHLWEKWAIFIKYCHPFSYGDMDFDALKKLGEEPVADPDKPSCYTPEQDRNRILIELLENRAEWKMTEDFVEDSCDRNTFEFIEVS